MATVLALYPVIGEALGNVTATLKDRKRPNDPVMRVLDNFSMVGGLGIVTSLYQAVKYEKAWQALLGPTSGDVLDFAQNAVKFALSQNPDALIRQGRKQPIAQAIESLFRIGDMGSDALMGMVEGESQPTTLDNLKFQQSQLKR
jgi:hypothetical protein